MFYVMQYKNPSFAIIEIFAGDFGELFPKVIVLLKRLLYFAFFLSCI